MTSGQFTLRRNLFSGKHGAPPAGSARGGSALSRGPAPPDSRHLPPFSRHFGQIDPDAPQRQEAQIVQSQLDLQDFLP